MQKVKQRQKQTGETHVFKDCFHNELTFQERMISMRTNLQAARKAKGLTQEQMAERLGISLRYYQNIEAGDRNGDFEIWDRLEDITGIHQRILRFQDHGKADNP